MIQITVAESAGFCPGVNAAIEKAIDLASKKNKKIYTLGQLIHNNDVIKELEKRGIKAINSLSEITDPKNSILVIRAHGIPPELEEEIKLKNIDILDATCPLVKKVHMIITHYREKGYKTVIFGDPNHAEVIGLKGYAGDEGIVVSSPQEAENLPFIEKVNLVSQTTQEEEIFMKVANIIKKKTKELIISDTICQPTKKRQQETVNLAKGSDLTIVVGGKHSANTKRLFDICLRLSKKAVLVENESEISQDMLDGVKTVFITAGASTPRWIVERVKNKVREVAFKKRFIYEFLNFLIYAGFFGFLSFSGIMLLSIRILGINLKTEYIISPVISLIFAHLINRISDRTEEDLKKIIILKHLKATNFLTYLLPIVSLILSSTNLKLFLLLLFFILISTAYIKVCRKITIPKKILIPLGWLYIYILIPLIIISPKEIPFLQILVAVSLILILSLIRTEILETLYIHSDLIGEQKKSRNIYLFPIFKLTTMCLISLAIFFIPNLNFYIPLKIYWAGACIYLILIFKHIIRKKVPHTSLMEVAVDIPFAGLLVNLLFF